eukprot:m.159270 g.159270  ORF g.159270 m.159270 type:complete len:496 (-) comp11765_c0_seq1:222-1709(-)
MSVHGVAHPPTSDKGAGSAVTLYASDTHSTQSSMTPNYMTAQGPNPPGHNGQQGVTEIGPDSEAQRGTPVTSGGTSTKSEGQQSPQDSAPHRSPSAVDAPASSLSTVASAPACASSAVNVIARVPGPPPQLREFSACSDYNSTGSVGSEEVAYHDEEDRSTVTSGSHGSPPPGGVKDHADNDDQRRKRRRGGGSVGDAGATEDASWHSNNDGEEGIEQQRIQARRDRNRKFQAKKRKMHKEIVEALTLEVAHYEADNARLGREIVQLERKIEALRGGVVMSGSDEGAAAEALIRVAETAVSVSAAGGGGGGATAPTMPPHGPTTAPRTMHSASTVAAATHHQMQSGPQQSQHQQHGGMSVPVNASTVASQQQHPPHMTMHAPQQQQPPQQPNPMMFQGHPGAGMFYQMPYPYGMMPMQGSPGGFNPALMQMYAPQYTPSSEVQWHPQPGNMVSLPPGASPPQHAHQQHMGRHGTPTCYGPSLFGPHAGSAPHPSM